ncbi:MULTISPECIES: hypothetical protein [Pseudomonas chlororaphis group]|uniref:hypothetical protein n=1 Tax=Pseudomonas chlororaphis group TaxID=136842 RepID=UPI002097B3F9|nr:MULTISPECIES: hypothetical protein [Pseudomonas chlororaphis group]MCO7576209.1 hypothetical protein [Pseudomonas protegens]MCO7580953.1 hypothetical protein [Pseudomonas chlororaphis]MCO7598022.1 hypothetical protein [Pseudomonas chlororaphis]
MSTFAVFGMSENWAREEARENTSTHKTVDGKRIERTIREWEEAVEAQVAKIMAGKKCVRLSPMFDAPQYAQQFMEMARASIVCRDLKIRTKAVLVDAKSKPILNAKTGAPKVGFADWAPAKSNAA